MITKFKLLEKKKELQKNFERVLKLRLDEVYGFGRILDLQGPKISYGLDLYIEKEISSREKELLEEYFNEIFQESITISTPNTLKTSEQVSDKEKETILKSKKSFEQLCVEAQKQCVEAKRFQEFINFNNLDAVMQGTIEPNEQQIRLLMILNKESREKNFQDSCNGIVACLSVDETKFLDYLEKWNLYIAAKDGELDIVSYMLPYISDEDIDKKNEDQQTPLYLARLQDDDDENKKQKKDKISELLEGRRANPYMECGPNGQTPNDLMPREIQKRSPQKGNIYPIARKKEDKTRTVSRALFTILNELDPEVKKQVAEQLIAEREEKKEKDKAENPSTNTSFFRK